ncbi:MAG TPA: rhomboid family intramembrane serine protease [Verrucomicrobiae bacterium]|nr:rhomboid family intramembrane serine protease [Verrucomicrobiae bacterium]
MLEDRDYMREPDFREPRISVTVALLIVNALAFIAQMVGWHLQNGAEIQSTYFALSLFGLKHFYLWQLVTFQFMHANWLHLLFNSLVIFFFGRAVEQAVGRWHFLKLYFLSGIIGGLVQMLFAFLFPAFGGSVVGASAGASGLVAAFALMNWRERFTLFFYFIPITMRGRTLLWISVGLAVFGMLTPDNGIANAAHLGGIITGALYMIWLQRGHVSEFVSPPRRFAPARVFKKLWQSGASIPPNEDLTADEYLKTEVDPILDKISAHGIQSLTKQEREILEKARSKMGRR